MLNRCTIRFIFLVYRYFVAAVSPTMEVANAILPAYCVSMLYFIGLLLRVPSMPHYWRWFIWVNPVSHADRNCASYETKRSTVNSPHSQEFLRGDRGMSSTLNFCNDSALNIFLTKGKQTLYLCRQILPELKLLHENVIYRKI